MDGFNSEKCGRWLFEEVCGGSFESFSNLLNKGDAHIRRIFPFDSLKVFVINIRQGGQLLLG